MTSDWIRHPWLVDDAAKWRPLATEFLSDPAVADVAAAVDDAARRVAASTVESFPEAERLWDATKPMLGILRSWEDAVAAMPSMSGPLGAYARAVFPLLRSDEDPREIVDERFGVDVHGYRVDDALDIVRAVTREAAAFTLSAYVVLHGRSSVAIRDAVESAFRAGTLINVADIEEWHGGGATLLWLQGSDGLEGVTVAPLPARKYAYTRLHDLSVAAALRHEVAIRQARALINRARGGL